MPARWATADTPDQTRRTVLSTGANTSIGHHTTLQLAPKDANVLLASRDPDRGQAAHQHIQATASTATIKAVTLDLADLDPVQPLADPILGRQDGPDVLANNAGVTGLPHRQLTAQAASSRSAPTTRATSPSPASCSRPSWPTSQVVTVASVMHHLGHLDLNDRNSQRRSRRWQTSNNSTLANALFTLELDRRLRAAGAATASVGAHPGYAHTRLQRTGSGWAPPVRSVPSVPQLWSCSRGGPPSRPPRAPCRSCGPPPTPRWPAVTTWAQMGWAALAAGRSRPGTPRPPTTSGSRDGCGHCRSS